MKEENEMLRQRKDFINKGRMLGKKNVFTIITFLIPFIVIIALLITLFGSYIIITGDFWVSEESALKVIQVNNPEFIKVIRLNRSFLKESEILVEDKNGNRREFKIESNILQSVKVKEMS